MDGQWEVLLEEWMAFYEGALSGQTGGIEGVIYPICRFVMWQKEWQKKRIWINTFNIGRKNCLGELPVLQLPMDRPRPAVQTHRGCKSVS